MTYDGHISNQNSSSVPRGIPDLTWKPCRSQQHRIFLHASCNQTLVKPEVEGKIRVRENVMIGKLRLEEIF
jgi:hypothetical protein